MMQSNAPIGIFDSGIGGLSVLKEIKSILPNENLIYFADSIHLPYGDREIAEIYKFSDAIIRFLMDLNCKTIVIACNTASAAALHPLREKYPQFLFVGMEPAVKPAAEYTKTGKVGVIATVATFQGQLFKSVMERFAKDVEVLVQPCPGLVQQIELGKLETMDTESMLRKWIEPMIEKGIDSLVLGCTHYPFVKPLIKKIVGSHIEIIDPAPAVARQVKRILENKRLLNTDQKHTEWFITTGDVHQMKNLSTSLAIEINEIKQAKWGNSNIKLEL
ncbi:MAG: glutamate racemase [Bacteroidetes bacterium]|nr:glutamate racemase [Bacteroidota bacterium]